MIRLKRRDRSAPPPKPILKPYAGVNANFIQRRPVLVTATVMAVLCVPYGFYYALVTPWLLVGFMTPLAILALIVIWTLPEVSVLNERPLERLTFLFTVTMSLWPNYLALNLPGLPWITINRLVATPAFILLLGLVSCSPVFRARAARVLQQAPYSWKTLALFTALQVLSIAMSRHPFDSMSKFVVHLTNETAMFFIAAYVFRKSGRTERWALLLWAFVMIDCVIGLAEYQYQRVLWGAHVPAFLGIQDETVLKTLSGAVRGNTGQYRTVSIFSTSLGCSEFIAYTLPIILHVAAARSYRPWVRTLALASVPIALLTVLATDSRLGLLGFFLSTMLYLFVWALRRWRRERRSLLAPAVLAAYPVIFGLFVLASFTVGRIRAKVWGTGQYDNSNQARIDQIDMGIPKVISHPFGHGVGMGGESLGYFNLAGEGTVDVFYIVTALEYGILGFFVFYGFFLACCAYAFRYTIFSRHQDRDTQFAFPFCISVLNFFVIKGVLAQEENHPLIFMMCGILTALVYRSRSVLARGATIQPAAIRFDPSRVPIVGRPGRTVTARVS